MLSIINSIQSVVLTWLTLGRDDQSFIGAPWIRHLLKSAPRGWRKRLALEFMAISPHYFYRIASPDYVRMPRRKWLEAEDKRNRVTRLKLFKELLDPYIPVGATVLDIGCGGGYLAKAVSSKAGNLFAVDISLGVLECAKILNSSPNIKFVHSSAPGWQTVPDGIIDTAYSVAVIQHVRSSTIHYLFEILSKKLKPCGNAYLIVQLEGDEFKEEEKWVQDRSLLGQLRWKYALNFFPRSEEYFRDLCNSTGLNYYSVKPVSNILSSKYDDVFQQHLLHVGKS
jgi:SAM-dependent methyltransferase